MLKQRPSPSIVQVILIAGVLFSVVFFMIISINTGDILWFWPVFNQNPKQILINCYGKDDIVNPWSAAYEPVTLAVNQSLSGVKRWDSLTMSEKTYSEYQTSATMMVLELVYDPPVRIHSFYKFYKNLDRLIIPLDGRHASSNPVFGRLRGLSLSGSLHINSTAIILTALEEQGLCRKP